MIIIEPYQSAHRVATCSVQTLPLHHELLGLSSPCLCRYEMSSSADIALSRPDSCQVRLQIYQPQKLHRSLVQQLLRTYIGNIEIGNGHQSLARIQTAHIPTQLVPCCPRRRIPASSPSTPSAPWCQMSSRRPRRSCLGTRPDDRARLCRRRRRANRGRTPRNARASLGGCASFRRRKWRLQGRWSFEMMRTLLISMCLWQDMKEQPLQSAGCQAPEPLQSA